MTNHFNVHICFGILCTENWLCSHFVWEILGEESDLVCQCVLSTCKTEFQSFKWLIGLNKSLTRDWTLCLKLFHWATSLALFIDFILRQGLTKLSRQVHCFELAIGLSPPAKEARLQGCIQVWILKVKYTLNNFRSTHLKLFMKEHK